MPQMRDEEDEGENPAEQLGQPPVHDLAGVLDPVASSSSASFEISTRVVVNCLVGFAVRRGCFKCRESLLADRHLGHLRRSSPAS